MTITRGQFGVQILAEVRKELGWQKAQAHQKVAVPDAWRPGEREASLADQDAWEKLCEKGEKEGWLEWTNEYSGSHLEIVSLRDTHPIRKVERIETDREREERLELLGYRVESEVTIRTQHGWAAFDAAQKLVSTYGRVTT